MEDFTCKNYNSFRVYSVLFAWFECMLAQKYTFISTFHWLFYAKSDLNQNSSVGNQELMIDVKCVKLEKMVKKISIISIR